MRATVFKLAENSLQIRITLHCNVSQHRCEAISGNFVVSAQNCLGSTSTLDYIASQMRKQKVDYEKGYYYFIT